MEKLAPDRASGKGTSASLGELPSHLRCRPKVGDVPPRPYR
jgi:hypothetical protein